MVSSLIPSHIVVLIQHLLSEVLTQSCPLLSCWPPGHLSLCVCVCTGERRRKNMSLPRDKMFISPQKILKWSVKLSIIFSKHNRIWRQSPCHHNPSFFFFFFQTSLVKPEIDECQELCCSISNKWLDLPHLTGWFKGDWSGPLSWVCWELWRRLKVYGYSCSTHRFT